MKRDLAGIGWWLDTSSLTPEESAQFVVREVASRAAPLRGGWDIRVGQMRDALFAAQGDDR
jgi:hypothetical protein